MADGVWKGVYHCVFGRSCQPSLNKFFDPSTPSMRKACNGGEKNGRGKRGVGGITEHLRCCQSPPLVPRKWEKITQFQDHMWLSDHGSNLYYRTFINNHPVGS